MTNWKVLSTNSQLCSKLCKHLRQPRAAHCTACRTPINSKWDNFKWLFRCRFMDTYSENLVIKLLLLPCRVTSNWRKKSFRFFAGSKLRNKSNSNKHEFGLMSEWAVGWTEQGEGAKVNRGTWVECLEKMSAELWLG